MEIKDGEILRAISKGKDDKCLNFLYSEFYPSVKKYICANSGNSDEAFDIFQEAVIVLYKQVRLNKFDTQYKVKNFLYSVSKNLWINRAKRKQRQVSMPEGFETVDSKSSALQNLMIEERSDLIDNLLGQIGENCRQILIYSIFEGFTMKEICHKMGYSSENAAKTRNYKCKQKLIQIVKGNKLIKDILKG